MTKIVYTLNLDHQACLILEILDLREKSLKSEKRIISGVQKLDTMRFIVGRFTPFSPEIGFL